MNHFKVNAAQLDNLFKTNIMPDIIFKRGSEKNSELLYTRLKYQITKKYCYGESYFLFFNSSDPKELRKLILKRIDI